MLKITGGLKIFWETGPWNVRKPYANLTFCVCCHFGTELLIFRMVHWIYYSLDCFGMVYSVTVVSSFSAPTQWVDHINPTNMCQFLLYYQMCINLLKLTCLQIHLFSTVLVVQIFPLKLSYSIDDVVYRILHLRCISLCIAVVKSQRRCKFVSSRLWNTIHVSDFSTIAHSCTVTDCIQQQMQCCRWSVTAQPTCAEM